MAITTEQVKELRDATGISIMQCKKALEEASGDMEKALIILRKKSSEIALKKGDRDLGSSALGMYLHSNGTTGSMVRLSSETDFVSKNEEFRKLAYDIAMHVAALSPKYTSLADITPEELAKVKEVFKAEVADKPAEMQEKILEGKVNAYFADKVLMTQSYIKNPEITIEQLISQAVQKFGERVAIAEFVRMSA